MGTKNKKLSKKIIIIILLSLVLLAGVLVGFIFQDKLKSVVSDISFAIENQGKPKFVFDTAKYPDWATAGNIYINPNDSDNTAFGSKNDLPISSMVISQCEVGSNCGRLVKECEPYADDKPSCKKLAQSTVDTNCFVTVFYNERKVDPEQEVVKFIEHNNSFGSLDIQEAGIETLKMDTPEGNKEYKLHYYDYQIKGGGDIKRGNAIGYISLASGHIDIRSVCSETSQLNETLPILSAIRFEG